MSKDKPHHEPKKPKAPPPPPHQVPTPGPLPLSISHPVVPPRPLSPAEEPERDRQR